MPSSRLRSVWSRLAAWQRQSTIAGDSPKRATRCISSQNQVGVAPNTPLSLVSPWPLCWASNGRARGVGSWRTAADSRCLGRAGRAYPGSQVLQRQLVVWRPPRVIDPQAPVKKSFDGEADRTLHDDVFTLGASLPRQFSVFGTGWREFETPIWKLPTCDRPGGWTFCLLLSI
jgi:hypothetical protein